MSKIIDLALEYGGFTSLDKQYLSNLLPKFSFEEQLMVITPPPSVINAYFAEIYQKQGPEAATDYYFKLSTELNLITSTPSFEEKKPFVRLNLKGKSYGFVYDSLEETALVFSETKEPITTVILLELAQVFPQYKIFVENAKIKMAKESFVEDDGVDITPDNIHLSKVIAYRNKMVKFSSFNQEELEELLKGFSGMTYYTFEQRQFIAYVVLENKHDKQ